MSYHNAHDNSTYHIAPKNIPNQIITAHTGSWLEIQEEAFHHNIACYHDLIGPHVGIAVVIKSNGYGHGLQETAYLCQANPLISWICTSTLSEALSVRFQGVTKPILVLSHGDADLQLASEHGIALAVHDEASAQKISSLVTSSINVHIKIDTGLSRFGLDHQNCVQAIMRIAALPHITVQGIYTHFAESGSLNQQAIAEQTYFFDAVIAQLESAGLYIPLCHAAKSVVAAHMKQTRYSFIRLGAGAYGLCRKEIALPLRQVISWKARIMHIRTVHKGSYIGYNRTYLAEKTMRIALIPVGYYEGYPLSLSNKGRVFIPITQQFAPIVGRVCMNQIMIDISDAMATIALGDQVELIADRDGIRSADLARDSASNNERELIARLNPLLAKILV